MSAAHCEDDDSGAQAPAIRTDVERPDPTGPTAKSFPALHDIAQARWQVGRRRYEMLTGVIENGPPYRAALLEISKSEKVSVATLYRWLDLYHATNDPLSLLPRCRDRRKSLLQPKIREIIRDIFDNFYATKQRRSDSDAILEVKDSCRRGALIAPHANTIRNHLKQMKNAVGAHAFLRRRGERKQADDKYALRDGVFSGHEAPWFRVQLDHTRLDVMVVDETHRRSIGRAFLTYAVDSYSRMILGFNISLDPSGRLSTGLCLFDAMLPKDTWLKEHDVANPWRCYGKPAALHLDNGKEFLSDWIQRACERYDIRIEHRPVATPHFGPHIERGIRTLNTFLRGLPGATFSNPTERGEYDSDGLATMTMFELEKQITEWITGIYHRRLHKGLGRPPQAVYDEAILGTPDTLGAGRRIFDYDQRRLRLDFTPFERRTIQHFGVTLDHLVYTGEVLSPYVHATDEQGHSKRFYFHRDPRRINEIYFYADDVNEYYPLTLREPRPDINLWDWRAGVRDVRERGEKEVDEAAMFASRERLRESEKQAAERTKSARRNTERRLHHSKVIPFPSPASTESEADALWEEDAEPFDDIRSL